VARRVPARAGAPVGPGPCSGPSIIFLRRQIPSTPREQPPRFEPILRWFGPALRKIISTITIYITKSAHSRKYFVFWPAAHRGVRGDAQGLALDVGPAHSAAPGIFLLMNFTRRFVARARLSATDSRSSIGAFALRACCVRGSAGAIRSEDGIGAITAPLPDTPFSCEQFKDICDNTKTPVPVCWNGR